jgi:hypothetical protein
MRISNTKSQNPLLRQIANLIGYITVLDGVLNNSTYEIFTHSFVVKR